MTFKLNCSEFFYCLLIVPQAEKELLSFGFENCFSLLLHLKKVFWKINKRAEPKNAINEENTFTYLYKTMLKIFSYIPAQSSEMGMTTEYLFFKLNSTFNLHLKHLMLQLVSGQCQLLPLLLKQMWRLWALWNFLCHCYSLWSCEALFSYLHYDVIVSLLCAVY